MAYRYFISVLLCFLLCPYIKAQDVSLSRTIDSIVKHQQLSAEIPGIAVGVIKDGKILYAKAFGVEDITTNKPLTTRSDFHMASVSKPFAGFAIMQLAEKGKLSQDEKLTHYLPDFRMKDARYKNITLRHILTHTSGIPDVTDYQWGNLQADDDAALRYVRTFAEQSLDFEPGTNFNYSNAAYNLLAAVIAKVTGTTFEAYMQENVFAPAEMAASTFLLPKNPSGGMTAPHIMGNDLTIKRSGLYPYNRIHAPSSTLHSNIDDMLKWAQAWLGNGQKLAKETTFRQMLVPQREIDDRFTVCLSWFTYDLGGRKVYFHSGGDLGYRSFFSFMPEEKLAVVVLGNNDLFTGEMVTNAIFERVMDDKPFRPEPLPVYLLLKKYIMEEGIAKMKEMYYSEKKRNPTAYSLKPEYIDQLGYMLLQNGHTQKAVDVFMFTTQLDPGFAGWHDSLGDGYQALGNKEKAIACYRQALTLDPSLTNTANKLKALLEQ